MTIYFVMVFFWMMGYYTFVYRGVRTRKRNLDRKYSFYIFSTIILSLVMGLKKYTVGCDWVQYLYVYHQIPGWDTEYILNSGRAGFYIFIKMLAVRGISDQGYIFIAGAILSFGFGYFYYKYSDNLLMTLFLHLTIGMFAMSMSGIRQSIAVVLVLLSFVLLDKKQYFWGVIPLLIAFTVHASSLVFIVSIPIILIKPKINWRRGLIIWLVTSSALIWRTAIAPLMGQLAPAEYSDIQMISNQYRINPLLIVIALAIPIACLVYRYFFSGYKVKEDILDDNFSNFYIMSCFHAFFNILSLNSNLIGRLSYYFTSFNIVLLANTVCMSGMGITKKNRRIAIGLAILFPLVEFLMATPGGTLRIDNYLFFWQ